MSCEKCRADKPGNMIEVRREGDKYVCAECGEKVDTRTVNNELVYRWDRYFHDICEAVASKSPCLSRKIGAILVRDHSIVSTGYNGPPRGVPHCGEERFMKDPVLSKMFDDIMLLPNIRRRMDSECPRRILGHKSGEGMEWCLAQHAEENCVSNAARLGVSTIGTTLYMNCVIPCKNCFGTLINAGVVEVVVDETTVYDKHTQFLIDNSNIKIRSFNL
jgi:dCMP deaminase